MGSCTSRDSKVEKPKRKITNTSNPYQVPQQTKTEEAPQLPKLSESIVQKPTIMSPSMRFLDGMSSLGVSRLKSTTTEFEPTVIKRPNIAPVLSKLKARWDHHFNFEHILVKAKYRNVDEMPAGDEEVQGLWQEIGKQYKMHKWNNVKTFKFDLQGCRKLTDKSLETIAKELSKNFRSLETLVLSFEECADLTDNGVGKMFEIMCPNLTKVRRFEINFSRCFSLSDKGLNAISYCISRYMTGIKNLSLTFNECNVTEKSLKNIGRKVPRRVTNLKKLNLTFNRCDQIKDDQNIHLASHKFNILQNLILNFKDCRSLTDKSLGCFGTQIRLYLPTLRQLTLNYHQCFKVTDKGLEQFQSQIKTRLKGLQRLILDFGDCPALTHQGVEALVSWLHYSLPSLELLKLNFSKCEQLNNKTLEAVAERISKIESLRYLTVTFSGNELINDKSLQLFGEKISKGLNKIRGLDLVFAHCNLITDNGFELLGNELKKLNGLQEIVLNFAGCEKITNKSLKLMENSMNKYYINLRKVTVDMRGCKRVTYDVKDEVRYNWKFNARLEVF